MPPEAPSAAGQIVPSRPHRRWFSRIGLGLTACIAANYALALAASVTFYTFSMLGVFSLELAVSTVSYWLGLYILPALLGLGVFWLVVRPLPPLLSEQRRPLPPLSFLQAYFIAVAALFLFAYLTDLLISFITALRGAPVVNPVDDFFELPLLISSLLTCVVAPVVEELTYRRLLIPRLRPYGDRFAVLASAVCFALMHGNLSQFFYAFALGVVLGEVFLHTGCVWQTILLHALINLIGGVIPYLAGFLGTMGHALYLLLTLCHLVLGFVCFLRRPKDMAYAPGIHPLGEGRKWQLFLLNLGMICFCLISLGQAAVYLFE